MNESTYVRYEVEDPVAIVTLDRPEALNAFTFAMVADIRAAVQRAAVDPAVVGIIITGTGRGFCAGLDATVLQDTAATGSSLRPTTPDGDLPGLFSYLLHVPKPVIAAVNGVTAGGGFVLATMCDLRFASTDASFLSIFTKRGLIAEHGTTWTVPRLVGTGHALDVLWSSRRVDAEEALRIGLVERVVAPGELLDTAKAYIGELAAQVSPVALAEIKRLVYGHAGRDYRDALDEADDATWAAIDRPDAAEGAAAMLDRRPPQFARIGEAAS